MTFLEQEIRQQPEVLQELLEQERGKVEALARAVDQAAIDYVLIAARGSSDHAALYAKYLLGAMVGLPVALAAPSLYTMYKRPPRMERALVVGISQSGASHDILSVVEEARSQGALTVAITNTPGSPLAQAAEHVLLCHAGEERSVAATKTYTAQLMVVAMLTAALAGDVSLWDALGQVPGLVAQVLELTPEVQRAAERYRYMDQCVVLGRGYNYATAYEIALKLKELTYVVAEPYSSADFQHGPIAIVAPGFPVLGFLPDGAVFDDLMGLMRRLKEDHEAELVVVSNREEALAQGRTAFRLPEMAEWLSPMVAVVPGQLFAWALTEAKGYDVDRPRGLRKVTVTR